MPLKTAFTELVGVEVPIVQGGMHHVGFAEMAAAVSNAGGLGIVTSITITQGNPDDPIGALRREIRKCFSLTGHRPSSIAALSSAIRASSSASEAPSGKLTQCSRSHLRMLSALPLEVTT